MCRAIPNNPAVTLAAVRPGPWPMDSISQAISGFPSIADSVGRHTDVGQDPVRHLRQQEDHHREVPEEPAAACLRAYLHHRPSPCRAVACLLSAATASPGGGGQRECQHGRWKRESAGLGIAEGRSYGLAIALPLAPSPFLPRVHHFREEHLENGSGWDGE